MSTNNSYALSLRDGIEGRVESPTTPTAGRPGLAATAVSSLTFSADDGAPYDWVTSTQAQTLSGLLTDNLAAVEKVLVSLNNGTTWQQATASAGSRTWSLSGVTLALGSNTIQVKVTDQAEQDGPVFTTTYQNKLSLSAVEAGQGGFVVNGASASDLLSTNTLNRAGDVNGDGYEDFVVGRMYTGASDTGGAYVIFGKSDNTNVNLASITTANGFQISNSVASFEEYVGVHIVGGGDFNGDGLADVVVASTGWGGGVGRVSVIYGKTNGTAVDLNNLGTGGFHISAATGAAHRGLGHGLAVGDVNGDGLSDVIVRKQSESGTLTGDTYVIYGSVSQGNIGVTIGAGGSTTPGTITNASGYVIRDLNTLVQSGLSGDNMSVVGDINGDGYADMLLGAYLHDSIAENAGRAYVVFGKTGTQSVNLSAVASGQWHGWL